MAEIEIVTRPEQREACAPEDLSDVSGSDESEEEEFTSIELVPAIPCSTRACTSHTGTGTGTGTISHTIIGTHLRHQWNSIWYSSTGTRLRQRPKPVQDQILQSWVPVVPRYQWIPVESALV